MVIGKVFYLVIVTLVMVKLITITVNLKVNGAFGGQVKKWEVMAIIIYV